jgi:integrase/recombinase XerD
MHGVLMRGLRQKGSENVSGKQMELFPLGGIEPVRLPAAPKLKAGDSLPMALEPFETFMHQREFSANTIKSFINDLQLLIGYLGEDITLVQCTTRRLESFIHYLQHERETPCSAKSLDRRITTLKVFFSWLASNGILSSDPAAPLIHHRAVSPLPQVLSDPQIEEILALTRSMRDAPEAPDARPHLLVTLILGTAIKKAECMNIALQHLDLGDLAQPSVYIHYEKPRQRFKSRRLALPTDWVPTFEAYMRRYQPKEKLFECTPRNLEYVLHTIAMLAHLPEMLTFETLRWTSAVGSTKAGMDPERLRKRLGLSRISWHETWPIIQKLAEGPL